MTLKEFQAQTARIVNENENLLLNVFKEINEKDKSKGGLFLDFKGNELSYSYISATYNNILFDKLEQFMKDKINNNTTDNVYVICADLNRNYATNYWIGIKK